MKRLDRVRLEDLRVDCIVGLHPNERAEQQPLDITLDLYFDSRKASRGGGLAASVDYARLTGEFRFLLEASRFHLLEEASEALARYVLIEPTADCPRAQVYEVEVTIHKPRALGGAAIPSLRIYRQRSDFDLVVETKPFGRVDVIYEAKRCGIYRLRLQPGGEIPMHVHEQMEEHELVLGPGLLLQGQPARPGVGRSWPRAFPHTYANPSALEQTVLCVDRPSFLPEDEREVNAPPGPLESVPTKEYY